MTTYDQNSQNINGSQINVGRDQIIHNLILVGQLLDFTKVEGLIPKPSIPANFTDLSSVFDDTFDKRIGDDLTNAAASAGAILSDVMIKWLPKQYPAAIPARAILSESPALIYNKLLRLGFWSAFYSPIKVRIKTSPLTDVKAEVIWLSSLQILWKKQFPEKDEIFGIASYTDGINKASFCRSSSGLKDNHKLAFLFEVDEIDIEQFRLILAGLVIDLIRLCSIASDDVKFWQDLISLMKISNKD